jgi:hypothetical protein
MAPRRKGWEELKPETRARYRRAGIDRVEYERGVQMQPGRSGAGKKRTGREHVRTVTLRLRHFR